MSTKAFSCFNCGPCLIDGYASIDGLPICNSCNDVAETIFLCDCGNAECADGADQCVSCICDSLVKDPKELDGIYGSLKTAVLIELVRRLECGKQVAA